MANLGTFQRLKRPLVLNRPFFTRPGAAGPRAEAMTPRRSGSKKGYTGYRAGLGGPRVRSRAGVPIRGGAIPGGPLGTPAGMRMAAGARAAAAKSMRSPSLFARIRARAAGL